MVADALVASGTLRNVGIDRVTFRHDVLREWAIANAVHADIEVVRNLPLERPAPSILARGVELAARIQRKAAFGQHIGGQRNISCNH